MRSRHTWRRLALIVTFLLAFHVPGLLADIVTVTLKNGQLLTGELTAETDAQITMDVPANKSGTIMTTRIIAKTDILKIERESVDQKGRRQLAEDYRNTQKYQLNDSSFPQDYYDQVIEGAFRPFLTSHPGSTNTDEITLKIAAWTAERDKVATGSIKRGGQWYDAAAASAFLEQNQASAILKEGERLFKAGQFYAAVMQYREVVTLKPLAASSLDQVEQRVAAAAKTWKAEVASGADFSGTTVQLYDAQNRRIQPQRKELKKTVDELLTAQQFITSAKAVEVRPGVQHWIAENPGHTPARYDFGRNLPDTKASAAELEKDQATLRRLDETIAVNNSIIQKHLTELLPVNVRLYNIDTILKGIAEDVAHARIELKNSETEAALKNSAPPVPDTSTNQAAAAPETAPQSFSLVTWFKTDWIWLAVGAVVVLYAILRRLDR